MSTEIKYFLWGQAVAQTVWLQIVPSMIGFTTVHRKPCK